MLQISSELLAMSGEAALLVKNGKVVFSNKSAQNLLGFDCYGKSVRSILGDDLAEIQAPFFIGDISMGKMHYTVRVSSGEGVKAFFISPAESEPSLINDAFIFSLRSNIMNMKLALSLLQENEYLSPELKKSVSLFSHECFKINRILLNVSTVRSILNDTLLLSPMSMDLNTYVEEMIQSLRAIVPGVELRFTALSSTEATTINADPSLLDTLLLNLISNVLMHAKDCSRITVSLSRSKDKVILSVEDNGCGIPANEIHNVFERYRHSYGINSISHGNGIGLMAARLIAGVHDGTLLLESREGQGTTVHVSLAQNPSTSYQLKTTDSHYEKNMETLLTGLADCLPSEIFSGKYTD